MRYKATKEKVEIWFNDSDIPNIIQPHWPNGEPWSTDTEAEAWAKLYVDSLNDETIEIIPGYGPDEPTQPRPAAPEIDPETGNPVPPKSIEETIKEELLQNDSSEATE